jgi:CubicO group peptidase (beta-lactamase class C family)
LEMSAVPATSRRPITFDPAELLARVNEILNRHPMVGLAIGMVREGRLEFFKGHGVADIASKTPITEDTVFRIASISKTFTAIAVMQLWEQGLVDLDAPANDYLRSFKLVPAKASFRPATVRHLLTHTAGIPEMVHVSRALRYAFGESFALDERVPTLGDYYSGALRVNVEPGTRFTYTDHSFSTAGQIVEDVTGQPLDRYMRERIFQPLGMADTDLVRSDRVEARLATGYNVGSHGPKPVTDRQWLTAAASMVYSSPRNMARYLAALMGGGANEHGSILKPSTLAIMFEPQYRPDPRIPGIGLAFDRFNLGGNLAIGHEGVLPGFNSQIFVARKERVGVMAFTNGAQGAMMWLPAETARLLGHLLGVQDDVVRIDVPQHPEVWSEICGWYPLSAPLTDMRLRSMLGLGAEVFVRGHQLMLRALSPIPIVYKGFVLHPDDDKDPYAFRIDLSQFGMGCGRIIFTRTASDTMRVSFDLLPLSLERQPTITNPRLWISGGLGALAVATTAVALGRLRRKRNGMRG